MKNKSKEAQKMAEVSAEIMQQLEQAQIELARSMEAGGPPTAPELTASASAEPIFGAAGSGQAKHVLLDHYFNSSFRRLWAYAGGAWRHANITNTEEQGLAQVAFAANRVDAWWDNNNKLRILRCWKTL
jgi:hypothetical protein